MGISKQTGEEALRILRHAKQQREALASDSSDLAQEIHETEAKVREMFARLEVDADPVATQTEPLTPAVAANWPPMPLRSWDDLVRDARRGNPSPADFNDLLTTCEIQAAINRLERAARGPEPDYQLDGYDYAFAGAAGLLGGLLDVFLVQVPQHPGFLGAEASQGGWLSNIVKERFGQLLPEDSIRDLEKAFPVSFDPSVNTNLFTPVPGLGPRTHRFQSLGHDPILGWILGTLDILGGRFTAIGKTGELIIQSTPGFDPLVTGEGLFVDILEALRRVGGHLASDVATKAGLPAPFMPLLQFLQFGSIGERGYTLGEVARQMYRSGYDFRHFIAGSVPVLVIEILVRGYYLIRRLSEGAELKDALPQTSRPGLTGMLMVAHVTSAAVNFGKVAITQNPLSISWAQWLTLFRYVLPVVTTKIVHLAGTGRRVEDELVRGWWEIEKKVDDTFLLPPNMPVIKL